MELSRIRREGRRQRRRDAGGEECITAWQHGNRKAWLIIHHFNTNWVFACVIPLHFVCVCVCDVLGLHDVMFVHALYVCIQCVCISICTYAFSSISVCMSVPLFEFVFDRCTYWQGFKEVFLPHLSLICPAEYRELLKGYYTAEPRPSQWPH